MGPFSGLKRLFGDLGRRRKSAIETPLRESGHPGVLADYLAAIAKIGEGSATTGKSRQMEPSVLMDYFDKTLTSPRLRQILDRAKADAGRA